MNPDTRTTPETVCPGVGSSIPPIGCAFAAVARHSPTETRSARGQGAFLDLDDILPKISEKNVKNRPESQAVSPVRLIFLGRSGRKVLQTNATELFAPKTKGRRTVG
jgi:hypothetical protein